jgi:hypothetical protein
MQVYVQDRGQVMEAPSQKFHISWKLSLQLGQVDGHIFLKLEPGVLSLVQQV